MVTTPRPELDKVAFCIFVVPTGTLPKLMFFGERVIGFDLTAFPFKAKLVLE